MTDGGELAGRIESTVLPPLRAARRAADTIRDVPEAERDLVRRLRAYTEAREAQYVALVEALRTGKAEATVAAKTREGTPLFPDEKCVEYGQMSQDKRGKYTVPFTLRFEAKK